MTLAYIGLGSNLGDREANLDTAIDMLSQNARIVAVSSIFLTEPEIFKEQRDFLNCVACVDTDYTPAELLKMLHGIEEQMGRERTYAGAPRVIDMDLLFFGSDIISQPGLDVPHPRLHLRAFVLAPMLEIAPSFVHPASHKSIKELLKGLKPGYRIERWERSTGRKKD
ncbi:MAG: 2-amino-4-hydroxy-6-hydroxymethyldihydropteridine diphosphokinase [Dehalococcoidia bacterium]|nr:2-amino-4-hydroxy-6-hydroxymethyldihydropteridine diphosphokinase [Dehalococcoidia bacterium]